MAPDDLAKEEEDLRNQREHGAKKALKARLCCSPDIVLLQSAPCMEARGGWASQLQAPSAAGPEHPSA